MLVEIPKQISFRGETMHLAMAREWLRILGIIIESEDHDVFTTTFNPRTTKLSTCYILVNGVRRASLFTEEYPPIEGLHGRPHWLIPHLRYVFTPAKTGFRLTDNYVRQTYQYADWKRRYGKLPGNHRITPANQQTGVGLLYNMLSWPDVEKLRLDLII